MQTAVNRQNQAVWRFVALPLIFLTIALLGGLRVGFEKSNFIFVAPPLVCLILAALLMILLVRGKLILLNDWISGEFPLLTNVSHILTLLALFAASTQIVNSVLPERGILFWLFAFFFLWTLWNNVFSEFEAKRLLRSLTVLFGTAFLLKHLILAAFAAPETSFWWKVTNLVLDNQPRNLFEIDNYAHATGYISFFALALYIVGLFGLLPRFQIDEPTKTQLIAREIAALTTREQDLLREQLNQTRQIEN